MTIGQVIRPRVVIGGSFTLTDHHGRTVTNASFHGRHALLFFGFTHCKRVCPETLGRISAALNQVGMLAERIQALYISVDPARDTPDVMRDFLEGRYERFLGLTGDKAAVEAIKSAYKVYAERQDEDEQGEYDVPHTAMIFIVGPDGGYLTHFNEGATVEAIAVGLKRILSGDPCD